MSKQTFLRAVSVNAKETTSRAQENEGRIFVILFFFPGKRVQESSQTQRHDVHLIDFCTFVIM